MITNHCGPTTMKEELVAQKADQNLEITTETHQISGSKTKSKKKREREKNPMN